MLPSAPPREEAQRGLDEHRARLGLTGKRRNPFLVWLVWPIITLGIYHIFWWYKINDEARRLDPAIDVNPVISLLPFFPGG
jgi:hypothetical protein